MNEPFTLPVAYEQDIYGWAQRQAGLLRAGRLAEIDTENLAEEIESVGRAEYDKLESALRVLLSHMLKWEYQPERRSRSWALTIREQRNRLKKWLRHNPSLKGVLDELLIDAYADSILDAVRETDLPDDIFPETNPYDWAAITEQAYPWVSR
jgi:hypothetical protein